MRTAENILMDENIHWKHINSHTKHRWNDRADWLADQGRDMGILKTKTKRKYALTDPFCCQRRQATSWLWQQNAPAQILVHCRCLEKNQDITHAGGPTLSNKISESFGMWCQNDQKMQASID